MAEDIVGGLFGINPAMYQQQQQQQVLKNAIAMQQLDPFQRAGVGLQQAGYNFAGALGGAMGGVDPQLQRISTLNAISKQIDQTNPESMLQGAKMLADAGFMQEALGLAQYARKANSELALAQQRMKEGRAATTTKEIQNAEYAANLRVLLDELESGPQTSDTPRQIALLKARLAGLPQTKEASTTTDAIKNAEYSANILVELDKLQRKEPTPEIENQIALLNARLKAMPQQKDAAVSANIQESVEIGRLVGEIDKLNKLPPDLQDPVRKKQLEAQLASLTKNTKQSEFAQILQDAGYIPGSEDYKTKMKEFANLKLTEKPEPKTEAMKNAIAFADLSSFKKGTPEYNQLVKEKFNEFIGKADATTNEIRNALAVADLSGFAKDTSEYNNVFKVELARLTTKPAAADKAPPSVGADAERISQKLYGKRFSELSQAEAAIVDAEVEKRDLEGKKASASSVVANVNAFTPASVTAQQDFIKAATEERKALRNAPDTLKNIEAAKKLIPTASTFMGTGGEPLLAAASFLNNRLGFAISTKGVTDATILRTRLFEGILDNLKKLDSQPSQEQQRVLTEALGNLGTDPAALEQILDRIGETVSARVERFNTDVTEAENRGVKFPFKPQIALPAPKPKSADGAALIPTGKSATTIKPIYATNGKERIMSTDGGKTWSPVR